MATAHNSAFADSASDLFSVRCNRRFQHSSVNAEHMPASDPTPLIDRLIAVKPAGLSMHAWSIRAGLSRNVFADVRRRNSANHSTIEKLLEAVGITFAEFEAGVVQTEKEAPAASVRAPRLAFQGQDRPRDIPVLGTAECADLPILDDDVAAIVGAMRLNLDDVVDYVRRPMSLDHRRDVYAFYFRGESMSPRYDDGELAYADPKQPPSAMDYVVVQLRGPDGDDGERIYQVLAKRLIRKTSTFYELEQFNPATRFRIPRERVAHMHRIMQLGDLVAF